MFFLLEFVLPVWGTLLSYGRDHTVFPITRLERHSHQNPAEAGAQFIDPRGMKGRVDLSWLV